MTTLKLFGKWTVLVWANAAVSFALALSSVADNFQAILGMALGVFTFVWLYSAIDYRLLVQAKHEA